MKISVIFTTYNQPDWLAKVIAGFRHQTFRDFELIVADDGSTAETKALIDALRQETGLEIQHVWHSDRGFCKSEIMNRAIRAARHDYLVFTDGDCIPRKDFLAAHAAHAEPGHFLSGGYFMLPMETSRRIDPEDIATGRCFDMVWLLRSGVPWTYKFLKLTARGPLPALLNRFTTTRPSWNGHNASGWKADLVAVNGFDERMRYGGQDRELGERLENSGIKGKQIRYSAICVHLDHRRGYKTAESIAFNRSIRSTTRSERRTWTDFGIEKPQAGP